MFKKVSDKPAGAKKPAGQHVAQPEKRRLSKPKLALIIALAVVAALCAGAAGLGAYASGTNTIHKGVSADGIELGGLTVQQAAERLEALGWGDENENNVIVTLPLNQAIVISASEAGADNSPAEVAASAYSYGHDGSIFSNLVKYLRCITSGVDLASEIELDESAIRAKIDAGIAEVKEALISSDLEIEGETLVIVKGARSVVLSADEIYDAVADALKNRVYGEIDYDVKVSEEVELDIEQLHGTVFAEAADAYYDAEKQEVAESITGYDFDKSEAQKLWDAASYGEEVRIPLTVTEPELTTEKLEAMLFADELATSTTTLAGSTQNRISNIKLAAGSLNGLILVPGEVFSYNEALGQRTAENGYKYAGAYSNGEVVQEIGGGICQASSTLYYCTLLANLKINTRTCHYFGVAYLPPGLDAAVSWKQPDFKFTNDRAYPIKIQASVNEDDNTLTISILGSDVDGSYVKMTYASWLVYNNAEYPEIATGYKAATYRCVYDKDDNLLSKEIEAYSEYHYHEEDSAYPEPSESPEPSENPEPSEEPTPPPSEEPSEPTPEPSGEPIDLEDPVAPGDPMSPDGDGREGTNQQP